MKYFLQKKIFGTILILCHWHILFAQTYAYNSNPIISISKQYPHLTNTFALATNKVFKDNDNNVLENNKQHTTSAVVNTTVQLPPDYIECNTGVTQFDKDPNYMPIYSNNYTTDQFLWRITGGPVTYKPGDDSASKYPRVQLAMGYIYTVTIYYTSNGITSSATMLIYKVGPVKAYLSSHDTTVCSSIASIKLQGSDSGLVGSVQWSTKGTGTFSNPTNLSTNYIFSSADTLAGSVKVYFTVYPYGASANSSACKTYSSSTDSITIHLNKAATWPNNTTSICSGQSLNYTMPTLAGYSFTWNPTLQSGSATGYKSGSSSTITDQLINSPSTTSSVVVYNITPLNSSNGCTGVPFSLTVSVNPLPVIGPITGNSSSCANTPFTLADTTANGSWKSSNTAVATISNAGLVTPVAAGTTTIRYTVTTAFGCTDSVSKSITINPLPVIGPITGNSSSCANTPFTLADTTANGSWKSSNTAVATISNAGVVTPVAAGTTTIRYTVTNAFGCTDSVSKSITINPLPVIGPITGNSSSCANTPFTLADTTANGSWKSSNTAVATISAAGVVTPVAAGTTTIRYTVTNTFGCTDSVSKSITINPLPVIGPITGNSSSCANTPFTLADTTANGSWKSSNTAVATISNAGVVTPIAAGSALIKYTVTTAFGCTDSVSKSITINPLPVIGPITGNSSSCANTPFTLADTTANGSWKSSNTAVATISNAGLVTPVAAGSALIKYTVTTAFGCTDSVSKSITINPLPVIGPITGNSSSCANTPFTLADTTANGSWKSSNTAVAIISAAGVVTPVAAGSALITYTVTNSFGCTDSVSKSITINPLPVIGPITGNSSSCANTPFTLADTTANGSWKSSNTAVATISAAGVVTPIAAGTTTIRYTVTTAFGCTDSVSKSITINPLPVIGPITGNSSSCANTPFTLADTTANGSWKSSNTAVATISAAGVVTPIAAGSALIKYTVTNAFGCTDSVSKSITINPLPVIGPITGNSSSCANTPFILADTTANGSWKSSNTAVATISNAGLVTPVAAGSALIKYTVTTAFGCTDSVSKSITINPLPVIGPITGNSSSCANTPFILADTTANGSWKSSNTAVATISNAGVVTPIAAGSALIKYTVTTAFGCTDSVSKSITINPLPVIGPITGNSSSCANTPFTLADTTANGSWKSSNTAVATISAAGVVTPIAAGTTTIRYTVTTAFGCTDSVSKSITINPLPVIGPITGNSSSCANTPFTLADTTANGSWKSSNTAVATISNAGVVTPIAAGSALIKYTVTTAFGCTDSVSKSITINPLPVIGPITGNSSSCANTPFTLADTTANGSWKSSNTAVATISNAGLVTPVAAGSALIKYTVTTAFGCTDSVSKSITINPLPVIGPITGNSSSCANTPFTLADTTANGSWKSSNTAVATISAAGVVTPVAAGTTTIRYTVTTAFGCTDSVSKSITINPLPVIGPITGNSSSCANTPFTLADTTANGSWKSSNTAVATISNAGLVTPIAAGTTTIRYTVTTAFGCTDSVSKSITINPLPVIGPITGNSSSCANTPFTLADTTANGSWKSSNTAVATISAAGVVTPIAAGTTTIRYTVTTAFGCTDSVSKSITINPLPVIGPITGNSSSCANTPFTLADTTANGSWKSSNTAVATISNAGLVTPVAAGSALIKYTVTTAFGCTDSVSKSITINPLPVIGPITGNSSSCANTPFTLADTTANGSWKSSNTAVATISNAGVVTPIAAGTTTIRYTVTTAFGCTDSVNKTISILPIPTISIHSNNDSICSNSTILLTLISAANNKFSWTSSVISGNVSGNSSLSNATTNNFILDTLNNNGNSNGIIKYLIQAIDNNNCYSNVDSVFVLVYPSFSSPIAGLSRSICIKDTVLLHANNIVNGMGTWIEVSGPSTVSFSDIHSANASVSNISAGKYVFAWQSKNNFCNAKYDTVTITVYDNAKANFTVSSAAVCNNILLNTNIDAGNNNIQLANYFWYANDSLIGSTVSVPNIRLQNFRDSVKIQLKAKSLFGCMNDSISKTIYFIPPPKTAFTLSDSVGCGPLSVNFNSTTTNISAFNYLWNFGNGQASSSAQPGNINFISSALGKDTSYIITLKAFNQCDTISAQKRIVVKTKAILNFSATASNGCSPLIVNFTNQSSDSTAMYHFISGDGLDTLVNSVTNFQHIYHSFTTTVVNAKILESNVCGNDSVIIPIKIISNPTKVDITETGSATCNANKIITFYNHTINGKTFVWNFGDGTQTTTTQSPDIIQHTYQQKGNYVVSVSINNGCSDTTIFRNIFVYTPPKVGLGAAPKDVCIGDSVYFTNNSDSLATALWNFGDNQFSSLINPAHAYKKAGRYNVWLKESIRYPYATCADSSNVFINVVAVKKAQVNLSDSLGNCLPFNVTFINKSVPTVMAIWNFGDGQKGAGDSIHHTYTSNGNFTASVSALNAGGCTYVDTVNIKVVSPTGNLISNNLINCYNTPTVLNANISNTDSIEWNFGDGVTVTSNTPTIHHTYTVAGTYYATATLKNKAGCAIPLPVKDTIKVDELKANLKLNAVYNCDQTTFNFIDSSKSLFGIQSWIWSTNNTNPAYTKNTSKTFYTEGNNVTSLIIKNSNGCTDSIKVNYNVHIYQYPKADIESIGGACKQVLVNFNSSITSRDSIAYRYWSFGNGATSVDSSAKIMYYTDGNYEIKLVVGTINKCFDSAYKTIAIHPSPAIVVTGPNTVCRGDSVTLLASGTNNFIWKDQNNNILCNNCNTTIVAPKSNATYQVIGYSEYGCSDIKTTNIKVIQPFKISASPSDTVCFGSTKTLSARGADHYKWYPSDYLSSTSTAITTAKPLTSVTYHVVGKDNSNCFADTASVKIIVGNLTAIDIGIDTVLSTGSVYQFKPVYNGPINKWNWSGSSDLSCTTCATPSLNVKSDVCIICTASNIYNCPATDTLCIKVFCPTAELFVPNAFSPDGDGINDKLMIQGKGIRTIKSFRIFSRWGELVFERKNFVPGDPSCAWDGTVRGKAATSDVFVYVCEVICDAGYPAIYKGNVAILK